jgi:hypothetical protein
MRKLRNLLLAGLGLAALGGCSAATAPMPQWSAQPQYYDEPPPYVYQRPVPAPYFYAPVRPRRNAPLPPANDDGIPDQAQIAPPVAPSPPALVPMDRDCGWWDPCHLWMGGAGT